MNLVDLALLLLLAAALFLALRGARRRRRQGGCCGCCESCGRNPECGMRNAEWNNGKPRG